MDQLVAELRAFSNSEGGTILVGVSDSGEIVGLDQLQVQKLNQDISMPVPSRLIHHQRFDEEHRLWR